MIVPGYIGRFRREIIAPGLVSVALASVHRFVLGFQVVSLALQRWPGRLLRCLAAVAFPAFAFAWLRFRRVI